MPATDAAEATPPSLLRHPPLVLFWFSRVLTGGASQMQAVAVGWQVYALTDSPFALGLVGLAQFVPVVLLTFVVGHVADRYDRRRIAAICQAIEGAAALVLAVGTWQGWLSVEMILGIVFVSGSARAFESPALSALLPGLIPPTLIQRATALSASANQTAQILGPVLGGVLYGVAAVAPYATATLGFLLAATCAALIRGAPPPGPRAPFTLASMFAGIGFIRSRRVLLGTISLDLFAVFLGGAVSLLPVYARDILETGPWGLGLLRSGPALGALTMTFVLARWPLDRHVGRILFAAVLTFGAATVVFGLSTWLPLSMAALFVLGAADMVSVVIRFSVVQIRTPDEMRGRVSAINMMFIGASNQLGDFESGVVASLVGPVGAVVIGGLGTIAVALGWMRLFPELKNVQTLNE